MMTIQNTENKLTSSEYTTLLRDIITDIKTTRVVVAHKINSSMMQLYWNIGKRLSADVSEKGYGSSVVKRLSADLALEFPDLAGFSPRNLWNMKNFYEFYKLADVKVQRSVALLPWRHNILIFSKIKSIKEAEFYIESALESGWTHDILLNFIKTNTYKNQKLEPKTHNFLQTLPEHLQDQADEILKSKYNVSFIGNEKPLKERELEKRLVEKIKYFLLELGTGFSFMGNQYRVTHNEKEYFVDMLFFNRKLHSLVAIDLKIGCFEPEYVGKMNYYLGILDEQVKQEDENPSIGIILCADKGQVDIELALRDFNKPIAVAELAFDFPEKEIKELINREVEAYKLETQMLKKS
jgi:predicted nuclease of restriction endonuclease-like (RecB) superfamily